MIDRLLTSGVETARVSARLVAAQENGIACHAVGILVFTPARARPGPAGDGGRASIPARLQTGPGGAFAPGPFFCFFSDRVYLDPRRPPQPFDAASREELTLSLSGFDGTALAPTLRLTQAGRRPVILSMQAKGDLFTGFGRSFADGSPAGYALAITGKAP